MTQPQCLIFLHSMPVLKKHKCDVRHRSIYCGSWPAVSAFFKRLGLLLWPNNVFCSTKQSNGNTCLLCKRGFSGAHCDGGSGFSLACSHCTHVPRLCVTSVILSFSDSPGTYFTLHLIFVLVTVGMSKWSITNTRSNLIGLWLKPAQRAFAVYFGLVFLFDGGKENI